MQGSRKLLKKCLTECGKMIKLVMKFQDIFTRPKDIIPDCDAVRRSNMFREDCTCKILKLGAFWRVDEDLGDFRIVMLVFLW